MAGDEKGKPGRQDNHRTADGKYTDLYDPACLEDVKALCELGATNQQIADHIGVSRWTIQMWLIKYPAFAEAVRTGKQAPDELVVRSLFEKATGYTYVEQQAVKLRDSSGNERVEVVDVTRVQPPDTVACIYWTKNRLPDEWKDRRENHHSGTVAVKDDDPAEARAVIARYLEEERQKREGTTH